MSLEMELETLQEIADLVKLAILMVTALICAQNIKWVVSPEMELEILKETARTVNFVMPNLPALRSALKIK